MPTYNFLLLELSYEYQNRKIIVVFCVNFCFLMLSFWGFLILLFLICFFRHFVIPISIDYQRVTNNQYDFKKKKMIIIFLSTSISLLFSSCSTILEIITGDRQCIYPNCTERATSNSAYCSYHKPYYLK